MRRGRAFEGSPPDVVTAVGDLDRPWSAGMLPATPGNHAGMSGHCEHDWQPVNHDGNRDIYKCTKCGELKRV